MTLARLALPAVLVLAVPLAGCGKKSHDERVVKEESTHEHAAKPANLPASQPAHPPAPVNAFPPVDSTVAPSTACPR